MLEAERGRVLRIGVPGVWVKEVLLEERDVELVVSRLRVEVEVEDGVRGSFGDLPAGLSRGDSSRLATWRLRVSTIVLRCSASSQFSTKASSCSSAMDLWGFRRTGSSSWGSPTAGGLSGGSRSSKSAEVSDLMRCWIELNLGAASSSEVTPELPLRSEVPVDALVILAMFFESGRFFGMCRVAVVVVVADEEEEFNEIDRLVLNEADWRPLRAKGGRVNGATSAAESVVLDSIRWTFEDRFRNFSPNFGNCGAGRVGLAGLWHVVRNLAMLA